MITASDLRTEKTITLTFSGDDFDRLVNLTRVNDSVPRVMSEYYGDLLAFNYEAYENFLDAIRRKMLPAGDAQ